MLVTENVPIRMRVIYHGNRIDFSTGYRIDTNKWDGKKQAVKNGTTNVLKQYAADINADLQYYKGELQKLFKSYELQEFIPSLQQIKTDFSEAIKKEDKSSDFKSFFRVYDLFMQEEGHKNDWTKSTIEKMTNVKKHLTTFNPKLDFSFFNESGLTAYIDYFRNKKFRNSTIDKQFNFLKWFLKWSLKKGFHNNIAYQTYKPKLKKVPKAVIFLTWKELNQLKNFKIPETKQYLERVRDVFLFSCYTSLRYSDVYPLKRSNIKNNIIDIISVKTGEQLLIELNDHSKAVLSKYKDIQFKDDKALPVITNQKMNDYLKELGEIAELNDIVNITYYQGNERIEESFFKWELLSTHAGRRTFICNALSLGIPPQVVMKWTGHSDYKSMKPYIDIADDIKATAMEKFNQL
ncbi:MULTISPECIES: site-specific integrase [Chitinophagaceae]